MSGACRAADYGDNQGSYNRIRTQHPDMDEIDVRDILNLALYSTTNHWTGTYKSTQYAVSPRYYDKALYRALGSYL